MLRAFLLFSLIFALLVGCGKKGSSEIKIVIGKDTLLEASVRNIQSGDTTSLLKRNAFLLAAAQKSNVNISDKSLISDFKDRLELESGKSWNVEGSALFYKASMYIKNSVLVNSKKINEIFNEVNSIIGEGYRYPYNESYSKNLPVNSDSGFTKNDIEDLIGRIFLLNEKSRKVVGEFLFIDEGVDDKTPDVGKMVSGLVFDSNSVIKDVPEKVVQKSSKRVIDNSKELIKYRSLESIKDSISRHSPNIQAIYKKQLKIHEGLGGIVYVKFRVNEVGEVKEANISRTQINNKELQENLLSYVRNIKFKAIPDGKGYMTFDFPFEFRPE